MVNVLLNPRNKNFLFNKARKANKEPKTNNQTKLKLLDVSLLPCQLDKCPLSFSGVIILGLKSTGLYEIEGHWGPEMHLVKSDLWLPCQSLLEMFAVVSIYGTVSVAVCVGIGYLMDWASLRVRSSNRKEFDLHHFLMSGESVWGWSISLVY